MGAVGGVAGLTLVSRALGFLRWVVQALTVGSGTVAGAYATANQVPNVLYEVVVGGALAGAVVPLLAGAVVAGRHRDVERTASGLLTVVLAVLVPLSLLLAALAPAVAGLFPASQGVDPALQRQLVADFLRMFAVQVPLYGIGVVLTGLLQAHGRFTWPALTPVLSSLVVMATYGLYGHLAAGSDGATTPALALQVLGWGTTTGVAALSLPLLWPVHRLGVRLRPTAGLERSVAGRALRLGGAGVWTLMAQQLSVLAVLGLARSGGTTGTVAVYQYTQAVYVLPYAVLVVPVATVLYPRLAAAAEPRHPGPSCAPTASGASPTGTSSRRADGAAAGTPFAHLAGSSTAVVTLVAVAGAAALAAASPGAERLFSALAQVDGMGAALAALAPGLVGYCLLYHVTRVLFAADRARWAALAGVGGWLVVAAGSAAAVRLLAPDGGAGARTLLGLAIGSSVGMAVAGAVLLVALARRCGAQAVTPTLRVVAVGGPVAVAAGACGRALVGGTAATVPAVAAALAAGTVAAALVLAAVHLTQPGLLASLRGSSRRGTGRPTTSGKEQP